MLDLKITQHGGGGGNSLSRSISFGLGILRCMLCVSLLEGLSLKPVPLFYQSCARFCWSYVGLARALQSVMGFSIGAYAVVGLRIWSDGLACG